MKRAVLGMALFCVVALAADHSAAPEYFKYSRRVQVADSKIQTYFALDMTMWEHMRVDLGDMRIYSQGVEVPYALEVQRGGRSLVQEPAKLLDLGERGKATEFKLEPDVAEYDTIALKLKTKNFTTSATVEGSDDGRDWRKLNTTPIFDFSYEHLGSNFEIRLPTPAHFQFLRINIADHVPAKDVEGASVALLKEVDATWFTIPAEPRISQSGSDTVVEWNSQQVPLERVQISVGGPELNFFRPAELFDGDGASIASTELGRVHLKRNGRNIDHENLGIDIPYDSRSKHYKLVIHNLSDKPLPIIQVSPLSYERRVYFEPQSRSDFVVYFSDPKTDPPAYDFSRLFQEDPSAARATLESASANVAYKGRPDERPWSERNAWVMWMALVIAVVGLGAVALRGIKTIA
jgi:hypothetical protein